MDSGLIKVIENFYSRELDDYRNIRVYLPPNYYKSMKRYPVVYMHDGQNLFDESSSESGGMWDIKKNMDMLYQEDDICAIVVGIDSKEETRTSQYSPFMDDFMRVLMPCIKNVELAGGEGDLYGEFIVETLKPYIDRVYRTIDARENTAICGSSMGGLISIYIGLKYQDVFSKIGCMSGAMFFAKKGMLEYIMGIKARKDLKIYMDVGTNETSNEEFLEFPKLYVESSFDIYKLLKYIGVRNDNIEFLIDEGGVHSEHEWCKRFSGMIKFLDIKSKES